MKSIQPIEFKIASEVWEFDQIYKLNYKTFVGEIPQHDPNGSRTLVDRFDKENTYIISRRDDQLIGMVAVRGKRPFSLDQKLENLDSYLPSGRTTCEIRLLSVEMTHRNGVVFEGLISMLWQYCNKQGYDLAVISGTVRQQKLYRHLGFVPFGPLVGKPDAWFQPMYLTKEAFENRATGFFRGRPAGLITPTEGNFLPGPVGIHKRVRKAFSALSVSHRSGAFIRDFQRTKRLLCEFVGAKNVEILLGSGTLANDAVAAQLSLSPTRGLILSNGEFGDRLIDHATRFGLPFEVLRTEWGKAFGRNVIATVIDRNPEIQWLWAVHCETSTGVLNDMAMAKRICAERGIRLCMDCISSIGTVPIDLRGVYLASGVSGKGLGGFPGLSMVFYNHRISPATKSLPRYLDLGYYGVKDGIPFTTSSNLVYALQAAIKRFESHQPFDEIVELSSWLRHRLRELDFNIIASDEDASPAVITIALPNSVSSDRAGSRLEEAGYLLSYKSEYLLKRNWIQICLMGEYSRRKLFHLVNALKEFSTRHCAKLYVETGVNYT
jgi:aspartate aminotransferase-like enzyme